jgi:signal transduction histidine kinase
VSSAEHAVRPPDQRRAWWAAAVQWRNWPLLVKLGVVLIVPVVGALVLGVLRVRSDVELAESYADIERIAELRGELVQVLSTVQHERNLALTSGGASDFQRLAGVSDTIITRMNQVVSQTPNLGQTASTGYRDLTQSLGVLPAVRAQATAGADWFVVLSGYGSIVDSLLEFDRALVGRFPDQDLSGISMALFDFQAAREHVSMQQALGLIGLRAGALTENQRELMIEAGVRLDDRLADAEAVSPPELWRQYETTVVGTDVSTRQALVLAARGHGTTTMPFTQAAWNSTSGTTTNLMLDVARRAASQLQGVSGRLQDSAGNRAGTQSVLLLLMVLLAAGIGGVVGRYLLRSVRLLRRTALDVANNRLPAAVASIRAGDAHVSIEPVPLRTTEEFGQLARAFDAVNGQAVRSAAEEASLRSNLRNIFVNLSRRSQGLVERQLRLMERLEQKEDDPDQLANLFKLDHLATRMRRNNENLMVLSGLDLGRRSSEPMSLPDVLRAAVSEVEHYQRAVVRSAPLVRIVGYAAGDLVRSVAELVENATAFSPPDAQVIISSQRGDDGSVLIDIVDLGIGIAEAELAEANQRVASGGDVDVPISRQMGLFVVGNLTSRHGIQVRLSKRDDAEHGLRASVMVPPNLVSVDTGAVLESPPDEPEATGVADRLESAGIVVRLPQLPQASTPASILFTAHKPVPENGAAPVEKRPQPKEFAWLDATVKTPPVPAPGSVAAATPAKGIPVQAPPPKPPAPPVAPTTVGPAGLPKRVPQAQLLATSARGQQPQPVANRDAAKTRGFMSSFQTGIQQREDSNNKGEETS